MPRLSTGALRIGTRARRGISAVSLHLYFVAFIAVVTVYYLFVLSNGTLQVLAPELLDKVFDNMLVHLLRGEFTVDRSAIDYAVVWCAEHAAVLVGRASAEKAHLAPRTALSHFIVPFLSLL